MSVRWRLPDLRLPLAVGRLFGVFGPGEAPHRLLPTLMNEPSRKTERVQLSPGAQRRDLSYVDDAVAALVELALCVKGSRSRFVVNIGSRTTRHCAYFCRRWWQILCRRLELLLGFGDIDARPDDVACFAGDPERLLRLLTAEPTYTLTSGIRAAICDSMTIRATT